MKIINHKTFWYPMGESLYCDNPIPTTYVLTEGAISDVAVYVGHSESLQFVSENGNKLSVNEAVAIFPSIDIKNYRY